MNENADKNKWRHPSEKWAAPDGPYHLSINAKTGKKPSFGRILLWKYNSIPIRLKKKKKKYLTVFPLIAFAKKGPGLAAPCLCSVPCTSVASTRENAAYLSWLPQPGWAQSRLLQRVWRKQPAGAWVLGLVSEESIGWRQTHKKDGSHCNRKHTLTGGHRVAHPGFKWLLCHQVTSDLGGKHLRLTGLQSPHVRKEKLGTRSFFMVPSDTFPYDHKWEEVLIHPLFALSFVHKTYVHKNYLQRKNNLSEHESLRLQVSWYLRQNKCGARRNRWLWWSLRDKVPMRAKTNWWEGCSWRNTTSPGFWLQALLGEVLRIFLLSN